MAAQGFPAPGTPVIDETGFMSLVWLRFFITLWNRSGAAVGNNSAQFLYPETSGTGGQVLTSQGSAAATIWTTLANKLSQFINDVGYITAEALAGLSTPESTQDQIDASQAASLSTSIPPADSATGAIGVSTRTARADHAHPRETNPRYATVGVTGVTWSSGSGAPTAVAPNASLYSRTDGGLGARLYVSNGTTWAAVAAV